MGDAHDLDRRHILRFLGAGMAAALAAPGGLAAAPDPCNPSSLPSHLAILDPAYPNALVPHAQKLAYLASHGKKDRVLKAIEDLVKKNRKYFQKSDFVKNLVKQVNGGRTPRTISEMLSLFAVGWIAPNLCEPVNGKCQDFGCNDRCFLKGHAGGECLPLPFFDDEPCSCACLPNLLEFSLMALILLVMFMIPGPEEIPAILAAISHLIIRGAGVGVRP